MRMGDKTHPGGGWECGNKAVIDRPPFVEIELRRGGSGGREIERGGWYLSSPWSGGEAGG